MRGWATHWNAYRRRPQWRITKPAAVEPRGSSAPMMRRPISEMGGVHGALTIFHVQSIAGGELSIRLFGRLELGSDSRRRAG